MGLDEEWLDPDTTVELPMELPEFEGQMLTPVDREDLEKYLDRLEEGGCNRGVLYWCLRRLGETEGKAHPVDGVGGAAKMESGAKLRKRIALPKLATREDMAEVVSKVKAVKSAIWKFRDELLLASDALKGECPLPGGMLTEEAVDAVEALTHLNDSLRWVRDLADYWHTPSQTTLMKSKGVLYLLEYLLEYVSMTTRDMPGTEHRIPQDKRAPEKGVDSQRLKRKNATTIAGLIGIYCEMEIEPPDLSAKLEGFHREHPELSAKLVDLLRHMEAAAKKDATKERAAGEEAPKQKAIAPVTPALESAARAFLI
jgi:hypothetical protein